MDIDIFQLPGIVRKRIHYVILAALACVIFGMVFVLTQKPFFRSTAELFIDMGRGPVVGTDTGGGTNTQQIIGSQVYLIQSRDVLREVVRKLDLTKDPYFNRVGLASRLLGRTKAEAATVDDVINSLLENLSVERNGDSYVFTVTVKHGNSEMAARIANAISESYIALADKARLDVSLRTTRTIAEQAEELRQRVLDAQEAVENFRSENGMISIGDQGLITDQQLVGLNQQLLAARQQVEQQRTAYEQARQLNVSNVEAGAIPETLNSGALSGLRSRYSQALDRQAELSANLGNDHPQMRAIRSQIASIRSAIEIELERVRELSANTYERAKANLASLETRFDDQAASTKDNGRLRFQLVQLVSEAQAIDAVYKAFLTRSEELSRQQDLGSGNSRIISEAVPSDKAVQAPKLLVLIAAVLFGSAAGATLAVARELLGGTKRLERRLTTKTGTPILSTVASTTPPHPGRIDQLVQRLPFAKPVGPAALPRDAGIHRLSQLLQAEFATSRPVTVAFLAPAGIAKNSLAGDVARDLHAAGEVVLLANGELRSSLGSASRQSWSVKVRTDGARPSGQDLENILQVERIGSGGLRRLAALSSSRISTAPQVETIDFTIVDCCGTQAEAVIPTVLKKADGIVIVVSPETADNDALDALMAEIGPWRDRLLGSVVLLGDGR